MVYVIIARGRGLIREDSCNLYKERVMGAARTKSFCHKNLFRQALVSFSKDTRYPYELHYAFGSLKGGTLSRVSRVVRSYQCFMRHLYLYYLLVARKPRAVAKLRFYSRAIF